MGFKLLYNPGDRKFRSVREKMLEWGPCPREAGPPGPRLSSPGEREINAVMAIRVEVNTLQFCSVSNSPLTHNHFQPFRNPFENKVWEVYFVSLVFIVSSLWFCVHMCMYSGCDYTTFVYLYIACLILYYYLVNYLFSCVFLVSPGKETNHSLSSSLFSQQVFDLIFNLVNVHVYSTF